MERFSLRKRFVGANRAIFTNRAGRFFLAEGAAVDQVESAEPPNEAFRFLLRHGHAAEAADALAAYSHGVQVEARDTIAGKLDYLILVPTLRCNLACSYCQVSRADVDRPGFDWTDGTLARVLALIDTIEGPSIKVEFQGGEPTLRLDLVRAVIERCERFEFRSFVICTNLSEVGSDLLELLERPDLSLSTSLDGDTLVHMRQRTGDEVRTAQFEENLESVLSRFGPGKVSALPTINQADLPTAESLIDAYTRFGFESIYLRPINYQGFARKRHPSSRNEHTQWWAWYDGFIEALIARNFADRSHVLEESYLSLCLRRIFRPGLDRHVDLRNPNPMGVDYLVVDYDGRIYPTDEARMLTRSGVIDLAIGDLENGYDSEMRRMLDHHSTSHGDPVCDACPYQPWCGRDIVDDLARYGRIDVLRDQTFFCERHTHMFDLAMSLIYSDRADVQYSLARWLGLAADRLPAQPVFA